MSEVPATKQNKRLPQGARVLMVRLSALGDVIFALETLSSLKHERPDVLVDFLVEDRFQAVLQGHPMIENLIVSPRKKPSALPGHLRRLRQTRYDVAIDLHGILKSSVQLLFVRTKHRIGYAAPGSRECAGWLYHERVPVPTPLPHRADLGYLVLRALGLSGAKRAAELPVRDVERIFESDAGRRVLLHPGTSAFAAFKRWPPAKFAALASRLIGDGFDVAVSFGPGEEDLVREVRDGAPGVIPVDGRQFGLGGLASVLRQADVVVAADTGPLHIAAAAGTRVVALFGPKDTSLYGPRGDDHAVLFAEVPCRPCKLRTCASPQCILGIEVAEVERRVREACET